jgi:deoxyribodipyrimidine photolyase-related protein
MSTLHLVYPNSVFFDKRHYQGVSAIWFVEEPLFFSHFKYHQQKLVLHRASMKALYDKLNDYGTYQVRYLNHSELDNSITVLDQAIKAGYTDIKAYYPSDYLLERRINAWVKSDNHCNFKWLESPLFLNTRSELADYFNRDVKNFRMESWYRSERIKRGFLMTDDNQPVGNQWNYDQLNRKPLPKNIILPNNPKSNSSEYVKQAINYVRAEFSDHPGQADQFWFPADHVAAINWFEEFLSNRFQDFGPYEDAIQKESESILFHSALSPLINTGLLEVKYVINRSLQYAETNNIPINSVEGFIRQLIGWREFMHGLYLHRGVEMRNKNFFKHSQPLPINFWNGEKIGIKPIDQVIKKVRKTAYTHHIERLMIVANFCVLAEFDPDHVYGWFMEMFIDAYDWVMVPNVYSMGLFADGGIMATKPYISSSNYIAKMSNYRRDQSDPDHWSAKWDAMYWRFMHLHRDFMEQNARMSRTTSHLDRMSGLDQKLALATAELSRLTKLQPYYSANDKNEILCRHT